MANQPPADDSTATNRVGGHRRSTPKPTFSQFGHWAWLNKALSDAGWRYYSAVRSYIFDADEEFEVDITDEVIGELLGKTAKSIGRARRDCYAAGVIEELAFWKESVRVEGKAKPEVRTFRRLIVHHEVPDGYEGPVNAYREKRRIEKRRSQEQGEARAARAAQRQSPPPDSERTNLSAQSDQGKREHRDESPAQCEGTDLSGTGTDLSGTGTDLSNAGCSDQGKQEPYLPSYLPSHQPTKDEGSNVAESSGDGWSVGGATNEDKEQPRAAASEPGSAGAALLRSLGITGRALTNWAATVDAALAQLGEQQTRHTLESGLGTAERPAGVIIKTRLPQLHARLDDHQDSRARAQTTGGSRWCGDCRPVKHNGRLTCSSDCDQNPKTTEEVPASEGSLTAAEAAEFMGRLMSVN